MHQSAFLACYLFFQVLHSLLPLETEPGTPYGNEKIRILDVGSYDFNGNNGDCIAQSDFGKHRQYEYVGLDKADGPNVNVVYLPDEESKIDEDDDAIDIWPFRDQTFDIIVSTSTFEHDDMFWNTFIHMSRSLRTGGFIFLCVPGGSEVWTIHRYPTDSYRFYPDAAQSLAKWARTQGQFLEVAHSSMLNFDVREDFLYKGPNMYADTNMIFWKSDNRSRHVGDTGADIVTTLRGTYSPLTSYARNFDSLLELALVQRDQGQQTTYMTIDEAGLASSVMSALTSPGRFNRDFIKLYSGQLKKEFIYFKLDLMVLLSNYGILNDLKTAYDSDEEFTKLVPRRIDLVLLGELFSIIPRETYPGVALYHGKCVFDFHLPNSTLFPLDEINFRATSIRGSNEELVSHEVRVPVLSYRD
jgi:hypothetical protein